MTRASTPAPSTPAHAGAFPGARTLFHVRGVPVRVDTSWFLIAAFVLYYLYGQLGRRLGEEGIEVVLGAAVAATLLFFGSVLAHELGHALASLYRGIPVSGITLFLMGGVTESTREADSAKDEFIVVGIGPFVSLVLAGLFGLVASAAVSVQPVAYVAGYLGWLNLALAIFNVLPGYPLDGGRMLRSILWGATGRPHQATRWAARVGQVFALVLGAWGVREVLLAGGGASGIWETLIALFLYRGAADAHRRAQVRERLARRSVRQVMGSVPEALDPAMPLAQAVLRIQQRPSLLWPVGVPLVGAMTLQRVDAVADSEWAQLPVGEVALPLDGRTVPADAPMDEALDALSAAPGQILLVTEGGRAVGLLTRSLVVDR